MPQKGRIEKVAFAQCLAGCCTMALLQQRQWRTHACVSNGTVTTVKSCLKHISCWSLTGLHDSASFFPDGKAVPRCRGPGTSCRGWAAVGISLRPASPVPQPTRCPCRAPAAPRLFIEKSQVYVEEALWFKTEEQMRCWNQEIR